MIDAVRDRRRRHDFRPARPAAPREPKAEWLQAMAEKLASEEGRALYKLRQQTVEPVFGLDKVTGEWDLLALAYNCKRLPKLGLTA